jgi:hypothetical protein|tara:strand:+ start:1201 stop:1395 length:195 start_codon:yes stop_codon:yes gene_type:complete
VANLRDDGYHVEVDEEGIETALRVFERLNNVVEYRAADRTFWSAGEHIGAFDLWGNLVIYHNQL